MQKRVACLLLLVIMISLAGAVELDKLPNWSDKYVNDYAGVLSLQQAAELGALFGGIDQDTTAELTFLSVDECAPYAPGDLAVKVANEWGIGKEDKDNGLLILYCTGENKIFAATGYGLEGILPDSKLGRLLDEHYVPQRDNGNVSLGIVDFSYAVAQVVNDNAEEVRSGNAGSKTNYLAIFVFVLFFVLVIGYFAYMSKKGKNKKSGKYGWIRVALGVLFIIVGLQVIPMILGWILTILGFILLNVGRNRNGFFYAGGSRGGLGGGGFGGGGFGGGGAGR